MTDFNWKALPEFVVSDPPEKRRSFGAMIGGYMSLGQRLSNMFERIPYTPHDLAVFLTIRVYEGKRAHERHRYWWGRFYNACSGSDPTYIKINGLHLAQALEIVDKAPDQEIPIRAACSLRLDVADQILQMLKKQLIMTQ